MCLRFLLLLALLSTQSCCGLFALFGCGTGEPIVPVSWDSPRQALATFMAAVRTSDAKVVYEALSEEFKEAHDLDGLTVAIVWKRLRERMPYVHLLGEAEVTALPGDRKEQRFRLETHGYRFFVEFQARPYWDLGYWNEGEVLELGAFVDRAETVIYAVEPETSRVIVRIDDPSLLGLRREQIAYVKAGTAWKLTAFGRDDEEEAPGEGNERPKQ